jgi:Protein of unknown function (DUF3738)
MVNVVNLICCIEHVFPVTAYQSCCNMALGLETCSPRRLIASGSLTEVGKAGWNPPRPRKDQMRLAMQSLLDERFRLAVHLETQVVGRVFHSPESCNGAPRAAAAPLRSERGAVRRIAGVSAWSQASINCRDLAKRPLAGLRAESRVT